jgi:hypothetical protein
VSTLGSKLRAAGVSEVLVREAEKMTAQLEQEKSTSAYWHKRAEELVSAANDAGARAMDDLAERVREYGNFEWVGELDDEAARLRRTR